MLWPRSFTDELRAQADIVRVVSDYVTLKKRGANHVACCPFHQEKTPSFNVNPARQLFRCFGCGKAGDVFGFIMEIEGASFPDAVRTVAEKAGVALPQMVDNNRDAENREQLRKDLIDINRWATEFFESVLHEEREGKPALEYLTQRGVTPETQRKFRLGYAPDSWDSLGNHLRSRGASKSQIERSGLVSLRESGSGSFDRFRGRLIFPISDAQGRIIAFGGRTLGNGEPKYLNSPETAVYTKGQHLFGLAQSRDAIRRRTFAILVEGYLDFLIPYQAGVENLVASLGTALTDQQVRLLGRYSRRIVVNFDPDRAGSNATKRSLETLLGEGFEVKVLSLPDNLDPDEFIRTRGVEAYQKAMKSSLPFIDYVVEEAVMSHNQATAAGKVETINAILPYLKLVKDRIRRAEDFGRIAERLQIDSQLIRQEFKRAVDGRSEQVSAKAIHAALEIKRAERRLLEILLNHDEVRQSVISEMTEDDYAGLRTADLFRLIIEIDRRGEEPSYSRLSAELDDEALVAELLPSLMVQDDHEQAEQTASIEELKREAIGSLHGLRCMNLAERQSALQGEINRARRAKNETRESQLLMEKFALAERERALAQWTGEGTLANR